MTTQKKKIGIVHFRVGRTDGVSLEIEKRKVILEKLGHEVKLISGPVQNGADFVIEELEFDLQGIKQIKKNCFKYFDTKTVDEATLDNQIKAISDKIEAAFREYHSREQFDFLFIHNIFSLAIHLPAARAFANVVNQFNIPVIATHHDFYWERAEYLKPVNESIQSYLEKYCLPNHDKITHVTINTLAQIELQSRRGIESFVVPDIFDFEQKPWAKDEYNADFLDKIGANESDLIILQATRIVERKGIEIAIQLVNQITRLKSQLIGQRFYNGKVFTENSKIIFLLAGYAENFAQTYLEKLENEIAKSGIRAKFIHKMIDATRRIDETKIYSLWDAYVYADLVTYPSLWEGWGNQFIEAVFAKKPIITLEYPVFKKDIKKEGYVFISLGDKYHKNEPSGLVTIPQHKMTSAAKDAITWLTSDVTERMLSNNFKIGAKNHHYSTLTNFLQRHLN